MAQDFDAALQQVRDADFHAAMKRRDFQAASALLDRGSDINSVSGIQGWSALHDASYRMDVEAVRLLTRRNADPNIQDVYGRSALHLGARHPEISALLVAAGPDTKLPDYEERTPLHFAVDAQRASGGAPAILHAGADLEARDVNGVTPLLLAIEKGNREAVSALLAAGAKPDVGYDIHNPPPAPAKIRGDAPLHLALRYQDVEIVKMLLDAGANPDLTDKTPVGGYRQKPLHIAIERGSTDCVRMLLARNADVDCRDAFGRTPLHYSVRCGDDEVTRMLVQRGANPDLADVEGNTPRGMSPAACRQPEQSRPSAAVLKAAELRERNPSAYGQLPAELRAQVADHLGIQPDQQHQRHHAPVSSAPGMRM